MDAHLCLLFFVDAVKVLVCDRIELKSFSMKCHLCMHVLTQGGLQGEEDSLCVSITMTKGVTFKSCVFLVSNFSM